MVRRYTLRRQSASVCNVQRLYGTIALHLLVSPRTRMVYLRNIGNCGELARCSRLPLEVQQRILLLGSLRVALDKLQLLQGWLNRHQRGNTEIQRLLLR